MYCKKIEFKPIWILVLLVYSKVSGGQFYDANNSATGNLDNGADNLHILVMSHKQNDDGDADATRRSYDKGLRQAEINFIAKLRQRQRQSQLLPAVEVLAEGQSKEQPAEATIDNDWQQGTPASLDYPDNELGGLSTVSDDLGTIVRFLMQHKGELFRKEPLKADDEFISSNGQKRAAALRISMARRSHSFPINKDRFAPSISVGEFYGALTNLGDFFQHLKHNLESLESRNLSKEQVKILEGQNMISNLRKEFIDDYPKPAGSAAFLHAIRNYRPSNRIRALVSSVPDLYRGTNFHDPVYKLAGLGK